jgi:putative transcriptional regulator
MRNKLKVYRAMYDLTQEDLAQKLGITRQTVLSIEKQKYDPSLELAFKISNLFKVKIEDIFSYTASEDSSHTSLYNLP